MRRRSSGSISISKPAPTRRGPRRATARWRCRRGRASAATPTPRSSPNTAPNEGRHGAGARAAGLGASPSTPRPSPASRSDSMKIGLIGHGAIARHLLKALDDGAMPGVAVPAVLVRKPRAEAADPRETTNDAARFLRHGFDVVLECAGHDAVREHAERVLAAGADLLVTSVGAFVDDALFARVRRAAEAAGRRLILPSAGGGAPRHARAAPGGARRERAASRA